MGISLEEPYTSVILVNYNQFWFPWIKTNAGLKPYVLWYRLKQVAKMSLCSTLTIRIPRVKPRQSLERCLQFHSAFCWGIWCKGEKTWTCMSIVHSLIQLVSKYLLGIQRWPKAKQSFLFKNMKSSPMNSQILILLGHNLNHIWNYGQINLSEAQYSH